jgi:hypothetical protein
MKPTLSSPLLALGRHAGGMGGLLDLVADQPGALVKDLARLGQRYFARGAADQLIAQHVLKLLDPARQGALVDGQALGGAAEGQLHRHHVEGLNIAR